MTTSYADKLRMFAAWLDCHSEVASRLSGHWDYPSAYIYATDAPDFGALCRTLGDFEKSGYNGSLSAKVVPTDDDGYRFFNLDITVSGVCEKVPVRDEDGNVVTKKVTKSITVETQEVETEEVEYEYKCPDSFLAL